MLLIARGRHAKLCCRARYTGLAILSVRPSETSRYCVKGGKRIVKIL